MRITTPKDKRQAKVVGKPLKTTSRFNASLTGPVRLSHKSNNSIDLSPKGLSKIQERGIKPFRTAKRIRGTPRSNPRPPKSASHRRRSSLAETSKHAPRGRTFSVDYTPQSIVAKYSHRTREGYIPENPNKVNQDAYFECAGLGANFDISLFGVCDGHGAFGHYVSACLLYTSPSPRDS